MAKKKKKEKDFSLDLTVSWETFMKKFEEDLQGESSSGSSQGSAEEDLFKPEKIDLKWPSNVIITPINKQTRKIPSEREPLSTKRETLTIREILNETETVYERTALEQNEESYLRFNSKFESGNLQKVVMISKYRYNLYLMEDIIISLHDIKDGISKMRFWFYFQVQNMVLNKTYHFNIVNMTQNPAMFVDGAKPVVYSVKKAETSNVGWERSTSDVKYGLNCMKAMKYQEHMISFAYVPQFEEDTVYFAACYPYTYSNLMTYIQSVDYHKRPGILFRHDTLCKSLGGNDVPILTLTSDPSFMEPSPSEFLRQEAYKIRTERAETLVQKHAKKLQDNEGQKLDEKTSYTESIDSVVLDEESSPEKLLNVGSSPEGSSLEASSHAVSSPEALSHARSSSSMVSYAELLSSESLHSDSLHTELLDSKSSESSQAGPSYEIPAHLVQLLAVPLYTGASFGVSSYRATWPEGLSYVAPSYAGSMYIGAPHALPLFSGSPRIPAPQEMSWSSHTRKMRRARAMQRLRDMRTRLGPAHSRFSLFDTSTYEPSVKESSHSVASHTESLYSLASYQEPVAKRSGVFLTLKHFPEILKRQKVPVVRLTTDIKELYAEAAHDMPRYDKNNKPYIFITGRGHPGETSSSYVIESIIEFLSSYEREARLLLDKFSFKIIPMLNPDGVIVGSTKYDLYGVDLLRQYDKSNFDHYPSVMCIKKLIQRLTYHNALYLFCDIQGEFDNGNCFVIGCGSQTNQLYLKEKLFVEAMSSQSDKFSEEKCSLEITREKFGTASVYISQMNALSFTMKVPMGGTKEGPCTGTHFSTEDFTDIAREFCRAILCYRSFVEDM